MNPTSPPKIVEESSGYTVIARRYRPQHFEDVVGQDHVVQSLRNAIRLNRVTHAYVFSGTRGVGKTSIARIFAKSLNCVQGPTETPCLECDICQAIAVGQDIDVIEIDGASNNGVEAVRELRQNAGLRPSRARFKIYYIDEVHMLSTGAFNALLKTLEEPPEHVKFFFATTEPNKIPITVLSRCQRYDFAGIGPEQVALTLAEICESEQVKADPDALRAVARRASGSLRDAQSLLEQLLSAGNETLTVELVHQRLGTASDERLLDLVEALADRDPARALTELHRAVNEGVQPVDVLNGLLDYFRDVMVLAAGAEDLVLAATPRQKPRLEAVVRKWPIDTILGALQILSEARGRIRGSTQGRLLVELALVKVARLENLAEISDLIGRLTAIENGTPLPALPTPATAASPPTTVAPAAEKKKLNASEPEPIARPTLPLPSPAIPPTAVAGPTPVLKSTAALEMSAIQGVWSALIKKVGTKLGFPLRQAEPYLAIVGPGTLAVRLPAGYAGLVTECAHPDAVSKIEKELTSLLDQPVHFLVEIGTGEEGVFAAVADPSPQASRRAPGGRRGGIEGDPIVRKVVELFEARLLHLDSDDDPSP